MNNKKLSNIVKQRFLLIKKYPLNPAPEIKKKEIYHFTDIGNQDKSFVERIEKEIEFQVFKIIFLEGNSCGKKKTKKYAKPLIELFNSALKEAKKEQREEIRKRVKDIKFPNNGCRWQHFEDEKFLCDSCEAITRHKKLVLEVLKNI